MPENESKAELLREIQRLQASINNTEAAVSGQNLSASDAPSNANPSSPLNNGEALFQSLPAAQPSSSSSNYPAAHSIISQTPSNHQDRQGRTIGAVQVDSEEIEDCFDSFFAHYSPQVPVIEQPANSDVIYDVSPLLFWTIVTTGSRKYTRNASLFSRLSGAVLDLVFQQLTTRQSPLQIVQALVLLLAWPLPVSHVHMDHVHTLAGACMQLSLQIGLHVAGVGQDFARVRLSAHTSEQASRALLWVYCNIMCQSASICDGLPLSAPIQTSQTDCSELNHNAPHSSELALSPKLFQVQSAAIYKLSSFLLGDPDDTTLQAFIEIFDAQARTIHLQLHEAIDILTSLCVRLHICVPRFMIKESSASIPGLVDVYGIATRLIEKFLALDTSNELGFYSTLYHSRTLGLAAVVILRLHRSRIEFIIDRERGERCYFGSIQLLRKRSVTESDLDSRLANILTELWSSSLVFRNSEGVVDSLHIRVRSRLTMNVFFDTLWWWRQEFLGQPDPFVTISQPNLGDLPMVDPFAFPDVFNYDANYFAMYDQSLLYA